METTTILRGVQETHATSKKTGKPYTKFTVETDGGEFSTFDQALAHVARSNTGAQATVEFETGQWGNDLKALRVTGPAPAATVAAPPAKTATGEADWDLIGLRKTRCALWAAGIGAGLSAQEIRGLVVAAEADIFHRAPAQPLDEVPF